MEAGLFAVLVAGIVTGAIVIWVVRKLLFERDHVPSARLEELKLEMQQVQKELYISVTQKDTAIARQVELSA